MSAADISVTDASNTMSALINNYHIELLVDGKSIVVESATFGSKLGAGSFACVFEVTFIQALTGTPIKCAVKVQNIKIKASRYKLYEDEVRFNRLINSEFPDSKNICKYYGDYEYEEYGFLIMELLKNVRTFQSAYLLMTGIDKLTVIEKVSAFLACLHEKLLISHSDVKMDNILLDENNEPIIIDFGLAKYINTEATTSGTITYMSPELCEKRIAGENIIIKGSIDTWAVGMMLWYAFGGNPFRHGTKYTAAEILKNTVNYAWNETFVKEDLKTLVTEEICVESSKRPSMRELNEKISKFIKSKKPKNKTSIKPKIEHA